MVYPGANGACTMYEDDGHTFEHRKGTFMRLVMEWEEATRRLSLRLAPGSRVMGLPDGRIELRVAGSPAITPVVFTGRRLAVRL